MELTQYIADSADVNKPLDDGLSLPSLHAYLLHAALGASGEASEILEAANADNRLNMGEEIGDAAFYLAMANRVLDQPTPDDAAFPWNLEPEECFVIWSADFLDSIKKIVIYGQPLEQYPLRKQIDTGWQLIYRLADNWDFDLEDELLPANREKLAGTDWRYSQGYSDEAALNRDTRAEQAILDRTIGPDAHH